MSSVWYSRSVARFARALVAPFTIMASLDFSSLMMTSSPPAATIRAFISSASARLAMVWMAPQTSSSSFSLAKPIIISRPPFATTSSTNSSSVARFAKALAMGRLIRRSCVLPARVLSSSRPPSLITISWLSSFRHRLEMHVTAPRWISSSLSCGLRARDIMVSHPMSTLMGSWFCSEIPARMATAQMLSRWHAGSLKVRSLYSACSPRFSMIISSSSIFSRFMIASSTSARTVGWSCVSRFSSGSSCASSARARCSSSRSFLSNIPLSVFTPGGRSVRSRIVPRDRSVPPKLMASTTSSSSLPPLPTPPK
mmetsp:Transcript_27170/g.75932  ORF Transcript_27170/g.75932 Transcript_27170/m.75932 type:complete len:311 (+) Transcript_27170:2962-3894(+)